MKYPISTHLKSVPPGTLQFRREAYQASHGYVQRLEYLENKSTTDFYTGALPLSYTRQERSGDGIRTHDIWFHVK